MKNIKNLFLYLIVAVVIIVIASLFYFSDTKTTTGNPVFRVDTEQIELGEIEVQGDYPADFTVTNTGNTPLEISSVKTSCMCTFAEVIIGDEKSPNFNMDMYMPSIHTYDEYMSAKKWEGAIQPGESATVRVIYKPHLMPVKGSVSRNVKFKTNDPRKQEVELIIHATVL